MYIIEKANVENPNEFWKLIASMGPENSSGIPWEVDLEDGTTYSNRETVLQEWPRDFQGLLTPPTSSDPRKTQFEDFIKLDNVKKGKMRWTSMTLMN